MIDDPVGNSYVQVSIFNSHFIRNIVTRLTEFMMQVHDPHTVVLVSCNQTALLFLCKAGRHIRLCVSVGEREVVWLHETTAVCTL